LGERGGTATSLTTSRIRIAGNGTEPTICKEIFARGGKRISRGGKKRRGQKGVNGVDTGFVERGVPKKRSLGREGDSTTKVDF